MMATKRILLVDDHPIVRAGYQMLIEQEPDLEVCGDADDLLTAMQQIRERKPHLIVLDISIKSGSGLELVKEIAAQKLDAQVLVCSMHEESLYAERALRAGARGYVNKEQVTDNIVQAIRTVLSGELYLSPQMTQRLLTRAAGGFDASADPVSTLSDRELEVFELIGRGHTTKAIAEKLELSRKTIETHREHIKSKLNAKTSAELNREAVKWVMETF